MWMHSYLSADCRLALPFRVDFYRVLFWGSYAIHRRSSLCNSMHEGRLNVNVLNFKTRAICFVCLVSFLLFGW